MAVAVVVVVHVPLAYVCLWLHGASLGLLQQAFKAASVEAGVGLLAEGAEEVLAPSVLAVEEAVASVSAAQASLLARIELTIEGEGSSESVMRARRVYVRGWVVGGGGGVLVVALAAL